MELCIGENENLKNLINDIEKKNSNVLKLKMETNRIIENNYSWEEISNKYFEIF